MPLPTDLITYLTRVAAVAKLRPISQRACALQLAEHNRQVLANPQGQMTQLVSFVKKTANVDQLCYLEAFANANGSWQIMFGSVGHDVDIDSEGKTTQQVIKALDKRLVKESWIERSALSVATQSPTQKTQVTRPKKIVDFEL